MSEPRRDPRLQLLVPVAFAVAVVLAALVATACSSDGDDAAETGATTDTADGTFRPSPPAADAVATPTVEGPVTGGNGSIVLGPGGIDLATVGYQETEFFLSGTATSYTSDRPLSPDGNWAVREDAAAPYKTRVVVRRPIDPAAFDGNVYVEWLNVSGGLDADPDWTFLAPELVRSGSAWIGVSAQRGGIEPGGGGPVGDSLTLKKADPARYGTLGHPGDDYSYDLFSQAGAAAWFASDRVLGGLVPEQVIAIGESQSAFRLSSYVNAVAPLDDVFDGYLLHSRAAVGAPLVIDRVPAPDPTLVRTDLEVPVLVFSTETDLVGDRLGYGRARQPDTQWFRSWEVAGTAHSDAYGLGIADTDDGSGAADEALFAALTDPPSSIYGGVITCSTGINAGPQPYVLRAAVAALAEWARTGTPPPQHPQLELDATGTDFVRDDAGNAMGGIRTPQVDVPLAAVSGLGQEGESFCRLFGTTRPLDAQARTARYGDQAGFVDRWNAAVDDAVDDGVFLEADAQHVKDAASRSTVVG